ncbi:DUF5714 domain-containing protein [Extibacter muris]|uniref:SAM-dependent methyltransferase n=1 Tax=Extibacter muris TaxID=1796622 RepID=A0A4R4FE31_9FIRM|nr:DUF5714 domain-containing protein [Extibacter muris]MCU0078179.1 DUF5714 domain-containing protein [Extibacter muris]TDA21618.1 SAM-dependent methyltransferase [Extibacter muris]
MYRREGACLVCGRNLEYYDKAIKLECALCGQSFDSRAACTDGHYVCDRCHAERGIEVILDTCRRTASRNPIAIMQEMMEDPFIYMHGPEHHVMAGAALLAAYHNCGGDIGLSEALAEMRARGSEVPGGACGMWGCCGAAVSTGIFMSIVTKATPLTGRSWQLSNRMTARALGAIAALGGPRCCKRDCFTAVKEAAAEVKETFAIVMELPEKIECGFFVENKQCLKQNCPYHPSARK